MARHNSFPFGRVTFLAIYLLFVLVPLYWMFITSIKPSDDYLAVPPVWVPKAPTLVHYTAALFAYRGLQGLINSLIISLSATVLSAIFGTLMAYSFARFNTGGKHLAFWVLSQRFLPPVAIVLPIFLIYRMIGLHDTYAGMIIAYTVFTLPVSVWMMFAYFRGIPKSMEEAALVDGCSRWMSFRKIALPLAIPGIVAAAIFAFIACWTEFFFALPDTGLSVDIITRSLPVRHGRRTGTLRDHALYECVGCVERLHQFTKHFLDTARYSEGSGLQLHPV